MMAMKRDASFDFLRQLHTHMTQCDVYFVGGDFNMSAFSIIGDVFGNPEFPVPDNSLLWVIGFGKLKWRVHCFSPCPSVHMNGVWIHTADNADLAFDPRDTTVRLLVFPHLRTINFPCTDSITGSE